MRGRVNQEGDIVIIEPKLTECFHCDFASGRRGMDRCGKCDGTGTLYRVLIPGKAARFFAGTEDGYADAVLYSNGDEGSEEYQKPY